MLGYPIITVKMTHLKCPVCGRFVSLAHFNPSEFDMDVYAVEFRGLGRGRGFKKGEEYSVLDSESDTMELIKNRILVLLKLFMDHDYTKKMEVLRILNIQTINPRKLVTLRNQVQNLQGQIKELKTNRNALQNKAENLNTSYDLLIEGTFEIIEYIEKMLSEDAFNWSIDIIDDPFEALKERLKRLINEYDTLKTTNEEDRKTISQLKEQNKWLYNEYDTLKTTNEEDRKTISQLKEQNKWLYNEYDTLKTTNKANYITISGITLELEERLDEDNWIYDRESNSLDALDERMSRLIEVYITEEPSEDDLRREIQSIEKVLTDEYKWTHDADDTPWEALKEHLHILIMECEALIAESE